MKIQYASSFERDLRAVKDQLVRNQKASIVTSHEDSQQYRNRPAPSHKPDQLQAAPMNQPIVGWHQDERGDWVAGLACGHRQHVRHAPPLSFRPWVLEPEGRARFIGFVLNCLRCDEESASASGEGAA